MFHYLLLSCVFNSSLSSVRLCLLKHFSFLVFSDLVSDPSVLFSWLTHLTCTESVFSKDFLTFI